MSRKGAAARASAARIVDSVRSKGRSLDAALETVDTDDDAFVRMLAYGTLRAHFRLEDHRRQLLDRSIRSRDSVIAALIDVGLFQLSDTRVPDHAAIAETVEAAKRLGKPRLAGLVNAVLRRAQRETWAPQGLEARFNHPSWIIEQLKSDWPDDWQQILAANDERAPMWLRVNTRKASLESYTAMLDEAGFEYQQHAALPQALRLEAPVSVSSLPGFADGLVSVQDGGAQIAAPWCRGNGATRTLDACAAPGGKSAHLRELAEPDDALICIDVDERRADVIRETFDRLKLEATITVADASDTKGWWDGQPFDAILLDAPCSASGVIRRHPDIKLLRRATDIAALAEVQATLLRSLWQTLKPGGRLLYVTCSVFKDENERIVDAFLAATPDATENDLLQNNNIRDVMRRQARGYQVLPGTDGMDGFFFACLEKAT